MKVTLTITDNPLAGQEGQNDVQIVVSSEPDLELPRDGSLPDPETLPRSVLVATTAIAHIAEESLETAFVQIARGDFN